MDQNEIIRTGKYDQLFQILKKLEGHTFTCIYAETGFSKNKWIMGTLTEIVPYSHAVIGTVTLYFIGETNAIKRLATTIKEKPISVYYNDKIPEIYPGYKVDPMGLIREQEDILGYSVKKEKMILEENERAQTAIQKVKK